MFDAEALRERQRQWDLFHEWEDSHRRTKARNIEEDWRWYQQTWELARKLGTIPTRPPLDEQKISYLMRVQETLARLPWPK
jgi:hypothetical protein